MEVRNENCQTVELSIGGMTCAACSARIERQLNKLPGVEAAVNLPAERAQIRFDPASADVDKLIATIVKTGFTATPSTADTRGEEKARKEAAYRAVTFDRMCRLTADALVAGVATREIAPEHRGSLRAAFRSHALDAYWNGAVRMLVRDQPDVLD